LDLDKKESEKKKIFARQLHAETTQGLKTKMSVFRKLPKEFESPTTTVIYGDKVTIWMWLKTLAIILIENKDLANSYRKHFESMWKQAK